VHNAHCTDCLYLKDLRNNVKISPRPHVCNHAHTRKSHIKYVCMVMIWGTRQRSWLRHYATRRMFADSSTDEVDFFNLPNSSSSTMALMSTQPLTEMSTRTFREGKGDWRVRLTKLPPSVSRVSRENMGALTSHDPMGLHGLLQG
jgi:hypothetical protein